MRGIRLLLGTIIVLAGLPGTGEICAASESELQQASRAYHQGQYAKAIRILRGLLYPQIRLQKQSQLLLAYKILGVSYVFRHNKSEAEKQFLALLALDPTFRLDPIVEPMAAVEFFEEIKQRNDSKLKEILAREKREVKQRRALEEEAARLQKVQEELQRKSQKIIERTRYKHYYWLCFVPFGAGQFQNGHRRKGIFLLAAEAGFGAVSLGLATYLRFKYPSGKVPADDYAMANGLAITQVASGAAFLATAVYGIVDALVYYQNAVIQDTPRLSRRSRPPITLGPVTIEPSFGVQWIYSF